MQVEKNIQIFSGSVNRAVAEKICKELNLPLGNIKLEKFANGEVYARYQESVRGNDVFLVQSVAGNAVNDALMELLIMTDAARRASARSITAVVTHYGYARQDRKATSREPITARLVANLMETAGIDRVITIDLHQGQIQGFFNIPVNHLTALPIFADYFKSKNFPKDEVVVVSPDMGRAKAAKKFADLMDADVAIMHKGRPSHNKAEIQAIIGDVEGKICIINDDMIDTAGSVCAATKVLKDRGAKAVYLCATHPVFSGPAYERLENAPVEEVVVCDTIPVPEEKQTGKIQVISIAPLMAAAVWNVFINGSVAQLFDPNYEG